MQVTIDETGCLRVMAESPLESYALNSWFSNYRPADDDGKSTLLIEFCPPDQNDKSRQKIDLTNCSNQFRL